MKKWGLSFLYVFLVSVLVVSCKEENLDLRNQKTDEGKVNEVAGTQTSPVTEPTPAEPQIPDDPGEPEPPEENFKPITKVATSKNGFALLHDDGSVSYEGFSLDNIKKIIPLTQYPGGFVALKNDGTIIITWGATPADSTLLSLTNVKDIYSNKNADGYDAIVVLKDDKSVVSWGSSDHGGDSTSVQSLLSNVKKIYSTNSAFLALTDNNENQVVVWGNQNFGGNPNHSDANVSDIGEETLTNVTDVASTDGAFAVLKSDGAGAGTVVTWGMKNFGGDPNYYNANVSNIGEETLTDVISIVSTRGAFAVLKSDGAGAGTVVTWGWKSSGGDSSSVREQLASGVDSISSIGNTFIATKNGSFIVWGENAATIKSKLDLGIRPIFSDGSNFAGIATNNSVECWGGLDCSGVEGLENVVDIVANPNNFVALKSNGTIVRWGSLYYDGNYISFDSVKSNLTNIRDIYANKSGSYVAIKDDDTIVTWGWEDYGGDSSGIDGTNVKEIYSTDGGFVALKRTPTAIAWGTHDSEEPISLENITKIYSSDSYSLFAVLNEENGSAEMHSCYMDYSSNDLDGITGISQIYISDYEFAALKNDHSVIRWNRCSDISTIVDSGALSVHSTSSAFSVLKTGGTVVSWGDSSYGGNQGEASSLLTSGVDYIFSNDYAFAAVKNGGVITWGSSSYGGSQGEASSSLTSGVTNIYSTSKAFLATKEDGTFVTWGDNDNGGSLGELSNEDLASVTQFYSNKGAFVG